MKNHPKNVLFSTRYCPIPSSTGPDCTVMLYNTAVIKRTNLKHLLGAHLPVPRPLSAALDHSAVDWADDWWRWECFEPAAIASSCSPLLSPCFSTSVAANTSRKTLDLHHWSQSYYGLANLASIGGTRLVELGRDSCGGWFGRIRRPGRSIGLDGWSWSCARPRGRQRARSRWSCLGRGDWVWRGKRWWSCGGNEVRRVDCCCSWRAAGRRFLCSAARIFGWPENRGVHCWRGEVRRGMASAFGSRVAAARGCIPPRTPILPADGN